MSQILNRKKEGELRGRASDSDAGWNAEGGGRRWERPRAVGGADDGDGMMDASGLWYVEFPSVSTGKHHRVHSTFTIVPGRFQPFSPPWSVLTF